MARRNETLVKSKYLLVKKTTAHVKEPADVLNKPNLILKVTEFLLVFKMSRLNEQRLCVCLNWAIHGEKDFITGTQNAFKLLKSDWGAHN